MCPFWVSWKICPTLNVPIAAKFIHHIFGESQIEAIAAKHNIPVVCKLPIDPAIAAKCDRGAAEEYEGEWLDPMVDFLEKMR